MVTNTFSAVLIAIVLAAVASVWGWFIPSFTFGALPVLFLSWIAIPIAICFAIQPSWLRYSTSILATASMHSSMAYNTVTWWIARGATVEEALTRGDVFRTVTALLVVGCATAVFVTFVAGL